MRKVTRELKVGDVIEIIRHDAECKMNVRRVRVKSIRTTPRHHYIIGANLHDENAWDYTLPLESWADIVEAPNNCGWYPFEADKEFDG